MIYIFAALPCEILPLADLFGLKPVTDGVCRGWISSEGTVRVIITGIGKVSAAAAVGYACALYGAGRDDYLINIGTCAGGRNRSGAYLINKVTDNDTKRDFYPDMLLGTGLPESSVTTVSPVATEEMTASDDDMLWEMEASGFAESASLFVPPHRIQMIKVVSDRGTDGKEDLTEELLMRTVAKSADAIKAAVGVFLKDDLKNALKENTEETGSEEYVDDFKCSETMRHELKALFTFCRNSGTDSSGIIAGMREEGILPASDRRSGKEALIEFRRRILQ